MKKITQRQIRVLKHQIKKKKSEIDILESRLRKSEENYFIQNCGKPLYNYKDWKERPLNISKAHETQTEWMDTGTVSLNTRKPVFLWVCKHCKTPKRTKYIATGHDHTDYSYEVCDCDGPGKPYYELE